MKSIEQLYKIVRYLLHNASAPSGTLVGPNTCLRRILFRQVMSKIELLFLYLTPEMWQSTR